MRFLRRVARLLAALELWIVVPVVAPVLIFESWLPRWAVAAALAVIPLFWLLRWFGRGILTRRTPLNLPILILLIMVPVGFWVAADPSLALPQMIRVLLGAALFFAIVNGLETERALRAVYALLLPATAALAVVVLLAPIIQLDKFPVPALQSLNDRLPDLFRPFWNPRFISANISGGLLALTLPVAIASALGHRHLLMKLAWAAAFLVGAVALVLTESRGAIAGLACGLAVMAVARSRWFLVSVPIAGLGGMAALSSLGTAPIGQFLLSDPTTKAITSLEGRLELWSLALTMIRDFPLTGIGLGMFDPVVDLLYPLPPTSALVDPRLPSPASVIFFHPHNIYLAYGVDGGIPNLIAFLALAVLLVGMGVQSVRNSRGDALRPLAFGLLGATVTYLFHGLFDSITSFIKASAVVWSLFGLQAALWLYLRQEKPVQPVAEGDSSPDAGLDREETR